MSTPVPPDPWSRLARFTPARIALGRTGASLPTRAVLDFALAHARAMDAVHAPFDTAATTQAIETAGFGTFIVDSAAPDRETYLRRPDLGRRLADDSALASRAKGPCDVAFVVTDGLSSTAVHAHAPAVLAALKPAIEGWRTAPVVIARFGRVALGDEIGAILGARLVVVLVGERPGLSAPDSLGAYITFDPRPGRTDAERNCVSNIRAEGLGHEAAAVKIAWLAREALRLGLTGVALKDDSDVERLAQIEKRPAGGPAGRDGLTGRGR